MYLNFNFFLASFFISTLIFIIIRSTFFEKYSQISTSKLINIPYFEIKLFIVIFAFFSFIFFYLDLSLVYCSDKDILSISENTMSGNINVKNSNIHIPSSVTQGLTNLGLWLSIAGGSSSAAAVVKQTSLPLGPLQKIGVVACIPRFAHLTLFEGLLRWGGHARGGLAGGITFVGLSAVNSIIQLNINKTTGAVSSLKEGTDSQVVSSSSGSSAPPSVASEFKINSPLEPHEVSDSFTAQTVMDLMNSTLILNAVIVYLLLILIMFIIGKLVISNQLDLNWIKRLPLGDKTHFYLMILLKMWGKSSLFFIFFIWAMLVFASTFSTYFIYVLITNFDSISEVYQSTKDVLSKK